MTDLTKRRVYKLIKPLPFCPEGRIFKQDVNGNYFHSMSDEEYLKEPTELSAYKLEKEVVENSPEWFELIDKTKDEKVNDLYKDFINMKTIDDDAIYDKEKNRIVSEWKQVYRDDKSLNSLSKLSILKLLRVNSSFSIEPTHRLGLHIDIRD